jgi:hypothetical protein
MNQRLRTGLIAVLSFVLELVLVVVHHVAVLRRVGRPLAQRIPRDLYWWLHAVAARSRPLGRLFARLIPKSLYRRMQAAAAQPSQRLVSERGEWVVALLDRGRRSTI